MMSKGIDVMRVGLASLSPEQGDKLLRSGETIELFFNATNSSPITEVPLLRLDADDLASGADQAEFPASKLIR
jgi:hypothetical protein